MLLLSVNGTTVWNQIEKYLLITFQIYTKERMANEKQGEMSQAELAGIGLQWNGGQSNEVVWLNNHNALGKYGNDTMKLFSLQTSFQITSTTSQLNNSGCWISTMFLFLGLAWKLHTIHCPMNCVQFHVCWRRRPKKIFYENFFLVNRSRINFDYTTFFPVKE